MELRIITPNSEKQLSIKWIEVETPVGNFVIHTGHAPILLTLLPHHDIIFKLETGSQEAMPIVNGVVDVTREKVTVIVNE